MDIREVAEWIFIADEDFKSAEYLNTAYRPNKEAVYYHCSQSVEKYLKGYLKYNKILFNYDHNLSKLIEQCEKQNSIFKSIVSNCNEINSVISKLRYPSRINLDENDVSFALDSVIKLKNLEPIIKLHDAIKEKFGNDWQEKLFSAQISEAVKQDTQG
jgi:HEPN domain-containing protein